jgi:DNA-directed RNA polymerase specialized sigma24 family protein
MRLKYHLPVIVYSLDEIIELGRDDLLGGEYLSQSRPTEDAVDEQISTEVARNFVGSLPPREQILISLRFGGGYSYPAIGRDLGMSHVGVQKMLRRVCQKGRETLRYYDPNL